MDLKKFQLLINVYIVFVYMGVVQDYDMHHILFYFWIIH